MKISFFTNYLFFGQTHAHWTILTIFKFVQSLLFKKNEKLFLIRWLGTSSSLVHLLPFPWPLTD
jgi:hypothetical protein